LKSDNLYVESPAAEFLNNEPTFADDRNNSMTWNSPLIHIPEFHISTLFFFMHNVEKISNEIRPQTTSGAAHLSTFVDNNYPHLWMILPYLINERLTAPGHGHVYNLWKNFKEKLCLLLNLKSKPPTRLTAKD
jgi:hypothetical protein